MPALVLCRLLMKAGVPQLCPVLLIVSLLGGCASSAPPLPPSLELPAPVNDLQAVRKGSRVSLTWTVPAQTTDRANIRQYGATRICRSAEAAMKACGTPLATVPPPTAAPQGKHAAKSIPEKVTTAYIDNAAASPGAQPGDEATYAVEVLNRYGRSAGLSNQVHVPVYPALPPPDDFRAEVAAEGVKLTWACSVALAHFPNVQYRLRVRRSPAGSADSTLAVEPDLIDCHVPVFDQAFEWEKTYDYRAAAVIVVSEPGKPQIEIESDDAPAVRVVAHDVFPPAVPSGLQAVFSGAGQQEFIDLVWSPSTAADFAGYNVYRHEEGSEPVKLNAEPIKTPAYRDSAVQPGKKYFYSVSAVDVRGNESARSEEANEGVP